MIPVSRTSRYIIRKLDPVYELLGPLAYPIIRIAVGVMMIPHGYGKLFNDGGIERTAKFFSSISIEPSVFFCMVRWYYRICWWNLCCAWLVNTNFFCTVSWSLVRSNFCCALSKRIFMGQRWI